MTNIDAEKLTEGERDFLERARDGRDLKSANRIEDRLRQKMRRRGLAVVLYRPQRWAITAAGVSALSSASTGKGNSDE